MATLKDEFVIPLKVVSTRLNHMKTHLTGIMKRVEQRAIYNHKQRKDKSEDISLLLSWDDWIYSALDVHHEMKQKLVEKQNEQARNMSIIEKMLQNQKNHLPVG
ncbi:hypothetical protein OZZ50_18540, partial [Acinetobacter baumannii]|nr:hypothetical protein [Acinetobacter baumannii]